MFFQQEKSKEQMLWLSKTTDVQIWFNVIPDVHCNNWIGAKACAPPLFSSDFAESFSAG
jgi:hypothetical protein